MGLKHSQTPSFCGICIYMLKSIELSIKPGKANTRTHVFSIHWLRLKTHVNSTMRINIRQVYVKFNKDIHKVELSWAPFSPPHFDLIP
jgi:hypothetical protein